MHTTKWEKDDGTFHLAINMAGAVSAGAYTAGALDFLIEALEQWEEAKQLNAKIPAHHLLIDAFSGASAGGMCAAIASVMVRDKFDHIKHPEIKNVTPTTNRFYESWVNAIDIEALLQNRDLKKHNRVTSLLDSTIIDEIAHTALQPITTTPPPAFISKSLSLFITLTNVRGVPYPLNPPGQSGSAEEDVAYYADRLEFESVTDARAKTKSPLAVPLPSDGRGNGWDLLKEAAKATGAFPIFLAPRVLTRHARDYYYRPWLANQGARPCRLEPDWPLCETDTLETLNVDGGVTNNNPFQLAHDFLACQNPIAKHTPQGLQNPREPNDANCAVLTIAPFTDNATFDNTFHAKRTSSIFRILPNLVTALISQSRFLGESLTVVVSGKNSRFVIAPSKATNPGEDALQCGLLGAFGGFFERGFRAHDYQLGRRNCQNFLRKHFRLALDNPIIQAGLRQFSEQERDAIFAQYGDPSDNSLPIIPLYGTALDVIERPIPAKMSKARIKLILTWIVKRARRVAKPFIQEIFGHGIGSLAARLAAFSLLSTIGKAKLRGFLNKALKEVTSET